MLSTIAYLMIAVGTVGGVVFGVIAFCKHNETVAARVKAKKNDPAILGAWAPMARVQQTGEAEQNKESGNGKIQAILAAVCAGVAVLGVVLLKQ